jgi:hypothetical protein
VLHLAIKQRTARLELEPSHSIGSPKRNQERLRAAVASDYAGEGVKLEGIETSILPG